MVLFSIAGQIVETVIYRSGFFLVEQTCSLTYWLGSFIYMRYNPPVSEIELLRIEMKELKREIKELKNGNEDENENLNIKQL